MANMYGQMEISMKASGKIDLNMVLALTTLLMVIFTPGIIIRGNLMAKESIFGKMAVCIRVVLRTA